MGIGTCPASSVMKLMEYRSSMHLVDDAQPIVGWCSSAIAICCKNSERVLEVIQLFLFGSLFEEYSNISGWCRGRAVFVCLLLRTLYPRKQMNFGV